MTISSTRLTMRAVGLLLGLLALGGCEASQHAAPE